MPSPCHHVVSLDKKLFPTFVFLHPGVYIVNGYRQHTAGDNPAMD